MSLIQHKNDPQNPIWVLCDAPYDKDADLGFLWSCGYGHSWNRTWRLSNLPDPHVRSLRPCLGATYDTPNVLHKMLQEILTYTPTFIIPVSDDILNYLCPETTQAKEKNSSIRKWAGSLLKSPYINYDHFVVTTQPPDYIARNWEEHEIIGTLDLGHVAEEYKYWREHGILQCLPKRNLFVNPNYSDLLCLLRDTLEKPIIADDIETIRPKKGSFYNSMGHCGYPYVNAIAWSRYFAFSYSFWDYTADQCCEIWKATDKILSTVPQIGQNYFTFDSHYLERMGFRVCLEKCQDTMIRHHILWIGLPHSLQFMTKQYTRQPYYKDEAQGFKITHKEKFMTYNAKDAATTFEIWEEQEKEFEDRKYLK